VIVYKATNIINGSNYIGITKNSLKLRKQGHEYSSRRGSKTYFHSAIRKYGTENFEWTILENCNSIAQMRLKETFYIGFYRAKQVMEKITNYNLTQGGQGAYGLSQEIREKLSEASLGRVFSEESKRKISLNSNMSKNVICSITGRRWNSCADASRDLNVNYNTLRARLNGSLNNNTSLKYEESK